MIILWIILVVVALAGTLYGIGALAAWLANKVKSDRIRLVLELVEAASYDAVNTVGETFVKGIKAGKADGKLTAEEAGLAFDKAVAMIEGSVGPGIKAAAERVKISWKDLIKSKIEKWVSELKDKWDNIVS